MQSCSLFGLSLGLVLVVSCPALAAPVLRKFSLDPASPAIGTVPPGGTMTITPDDILAPGPAVRTDGTALNLKDDFPHGDFDNLDALSLGRDPISLLIPLFFSVDRVTVGLPSTAVFNEAQPGVESAAGDVYVASPPFAGTNTLFINETSGLTRN